MKKNWWLVFIAASFGVLVFFSFLALPFFDRLSSDKLISPLPEIKEEQKEEQAATPSGKDDASLPQKIKEDKTQQFTPSQFFIHQDIQATVFWVGETASEESGYITNEISAWDANWVANYGGVDDPQNRNGFFPADFTPRENPFYIALPYSDFDAGRSRKSNASNIPWYKEKVGKNQSIVKNRWLKIGIGEKVCFAQWEDVGPGETDDFSYVFGTTRPKNQFSGIDLSPAVRDCLGIGGMVKVTWQFIEEKDVPNGPWKEIITRSGTNW